MTQDFKINVFIVGAQKAGTTALAHFLSQHSEICICPVKELHFFDYEQPVTGWNQREVNELIQKSYSNYAGQPIIGDATPIYMYFRHVPARIKEYNPHAKLIVLLRNPVERAISHYCMNRSNGNERFSPGVALRAEKLRLLRDRSNYERGSALRRYSYVDRGYYSRQIKNMLRYFPSEQILLLRSDSLLTEHGRTMQKIYDFLGISNQIFIPRQERLHVGMCDYRIGRSVYRYLSNIFEEELYELERFLGIDLDDWKERNELLSR